MKARAAALITIFTLAACSQKPAEIAKSRTPAAEPVRILMFYVNPEAPAVDEKTQLCYGVDNATTVRLEPPIEHLWPTPTRCFEVPTRAATYTLIAERGDEKISRSVKVAPIPPRAMLFNVSVSKAEVKPGETISVCFNARNSVRASITPGVWVGPHGPSLGCIKDQPNHDTTYVIKAFGAGGDAATEETIVRVKQ